MAPQYPEWQDKEPFKSVLAGDLQGVLSGGYHALIEVVTATHSDVTTYKFCNSTGPQLRPHPDDDTEGQTAERRRYSRLAANPA
jgi:hypothetical protein